MSNGWKARAESAVGQKEGERRGEGRGGEERGEELGGLDRKVDAALLHTWFLPTAAASTVVVIASIGYLAVRPSKPDPIRLSIYDPPIRHQSQAVRCTRQRPANMIRK